MFDRSILECILPAMKNLFATFRAILVLIFFASTAAWAHRVKVADHDAAQKIVQDGAQLVADYGSYQLYEVEKLSPELLQNERVEIRDDFHAIHLNAARIDTTTPAAKALRQARGAFVGK